MAVDLNKVKNDSEVKAYLEIGDEHLQAQGYTEHGLRHADLVARISLNIMRQLGKPSRDAELASIAGYLHDIGNVASRCLHGQTGAVIARDILSRLGMPPREVAAVVGAVGNHDPEDTSRAVSEISAAVILGDKTDVHRTRVRNEDLATFDLHDRVNYAVRRSFLRVDDQEKLIILELEIDPSISSLVEYFELFLNRMLMCRHAARFLGCSFDIKINGNRLL